MPAIRASALPFRASPPEEKVALIEALWSVVVAFVDLAFRLNFAARTRIGMFDLKAARVNRAGLSVG